jgi:cysteinyl-tRNA synthetase
VALRLYNTLTRRVETFDPLQPGRVSLYVCGMTPSFHPHLGHARTFLTFDVLVRYLRARGFEVTYVRNITDIDDKIIERANAEGVAWDDVVRRYYGEFTVCAQRLGLLTPSVEPRATDEISGMVEFIRRLVDLGAAYETADGVYFSVAHDPDYGSLSRRNLDELRAGERIAVREEKKDPLDFALWKKAKPGEPTWPSPWGPGRPGWHIECSALCRRYLGDQFDIHGGASDLIFPHHENEIAQTETATGKHPMARFWIHAGLLNVDGQKMSKSAGNFVPLPELLDRFPAAAVRYLFLQTGYRKPSNFSLAALEAAVRGLRGLYADVDALPDGPSAPDGVADARRQAVPEEFAAYLDDDLNTAGALGWLQRALRAERGADGEAAARRARARGLRACLEVLGLPLSAAEAGLAAESAEVRLDDDQRSLLVAIAGDEAPDDRTLIQRVVDLRHAARARRDYAESDRLRDALARAGVVLHDGKNTTQWSFHGRT